MPAKSKKVVGKKVSAKKPTQKSVRTSKAKVVSVEVVVISNLKPPEVPNLQSPEVLKHIKKVEAIIKDVEATIKSNKEIGAEPIIPPIKDFAIQATKLSRQAIQTGASVLVYAWACGKLLIAAKAKLGRSDFGEWRDKNLGPDVISERTSQRYMVLAKQCDDVKALLEWSPSLRQAYIACGILPEPPERENTDGIDSDQIKREALLASITGIQKKLRMFSGLKGKLGAADKTHLKLAKRQIDKFFEQILA